MHLRLLAATAAAALFVSAGVAEAVTPEHPRAASGASVTVAGMAFGPSSVSVPLGASVTWSFQDAVAHTTTSDEGFWDSGAKASGTTYARAFGSAGTFGYHCTIHPMMHGTVKVPVAATGSPAKGWKLTWAKARTAGTTYDVETRLGTGAWRSLRSGGTSARFDPAKAGKYQVRARTVKGAARSGWSPTVTVTVS